ncbi:hypothetical protein HK103_003830 [Boothiomyces macroporosus]|uniref:prephenate dehydratase n=1 Tax=Boothiomyces macroporosus TaxID=261099 RepID=A0AAD5Y8G8_9FUNG|nr:hypothetical protein HK103_003830 [Boothiomyces macroporosus]
MTQSAKVGFEGTIGSFSEEALNNLFRQDAFQQIQKEAIGFPTFEAVCQKVADGSLKYGLLPIENSIAGSCFDVLDLISKHNLSIVGEYEQEERQLLVALPGVSLNEITEVHSHPYAFDQCRPYLATLNKKLVQALDTAESCKLIQNQKSKTIAAIAGAYAAKLYGLNVLHELESLAVTRYILVSKTAVIPERHLIPRTSMEIVLKNQVGAFLKAITVFSHRDINISKIESRPSSRSILLRKPWEYVVYLDVDGGLNEDKLGKAIENLKEFATVRVLGSYPRYQSPPKESSGVYGFGV